MNSVLIKRERKCILLVKRFTASRAGASAEDDCIGRDSGGNDDETTGGMNMADQMSKEYDAVKELGLCVLHVGINANGEEDALKIADEFQTLMGFIPRVGNSSIFASDLIEIMKKDGPGEKGHIAIGCHDVDAAVAFFEKRGMGVKPETAKKNPDGSLMFIYLDKQIAGFAIHLKQY